MSIKIISIFDKHEDFIELQYNSIMKHVKGDYEYIIFNNALYKSQCIKNEEECKRLNINYINIQPLRNGGPSEKAGTGLNNAFSYLTNEKVFKIDSDMFFMKDININELLDKDLVYAPNYKPGKIVMWSGFFGLNLEKFDLKLNFMPHVTSHGDTFIQSELLTKNRDLTQRFNYLISIHSSSNEETTISINNDNVVKFNNNGVTYNQRPEFYNEKVINESVMKAKQYVKLLTDNDFPKPLMIDIIDYDGLDFLIHFKSANWTNYDMSYLINKKKAFINFLQKT